MADLRGRIFCIANINKIVKDKEFKYTCITILSVANMMKILSKLEKSSLAVFTISDLQKIIGKSEKIAYVYLNRMLKRGLIHKIEGGKFTIYEDPFLISTQLVYPSYISFLSAIFLHGKTTQTVNEILVATSRKKGGLDVFGMRVKFVRVNPKFMFGFRRIEKGGSYIFLADLEKAIIDSLYLPRYCPLSEIFNALKDADVEKLLEYASILGVESINRRVGYMLELLGAKTDLKVRGRTPYKLNPVIKSYGKFDSKWRLYINEVLE
ncbi:MAG: hypothetical protein QXE79_08375 [Candidatus Bathyarchaeia archaeon]